MSKISELHEGIYRVLAGAGAMFDGGSDQSRVEMAKAWVEHFDSAENVEQWVSAGCWDVDTAFTLRAAGFRPGKDTLAYRPNHKRDDTEAMYALCNGDVSIKNLVW